MTFALAGSIITQSGNDTSLSGLSGIAGVTTTTVNGRSIYNIGTLRISVTGTLTISPRTEMIISGTPAARPLFYAGATTANLTIGSSVTQNGAKVFTTLPWLVTTVRSGDTSIFAGHDFNWQQGTFTWHEGTFVCASGASWGAGTNFASESDGAATITINEGAGLQGVGNASEVQFHVVERNAVINGLRVYGLNAQDAKISLARLRTAPKIILNGSYGLTSFTAAIKNEFLTLRDYSGTAMFGDARFWDGCRLRFVNSALGTAHLVGAHTGFNRQGIAEFKQELTINTKTSAGVAIGSSVSYLKDVTNVNRVNYTYTTPNINYTPDNTYILAHNATTGIGSYTTDGGVLVGVVARTTDGTTFPFDRRGNADSSTDLFTIHTWNYGYQYATNTRALKGNGGTNFDAIMVADSNVTLSQSAATTLLGSNVTYNTGSNALTIRASSTLDNLYDMEKARKCQAVQANLEYPTIGTMAWTASGTSLSTALALTLNSGQTLTPGTKLTTFTTSAAATINGTVSGFTSWTGNKAVNVSGSTALMTFDRATIAWTPSAYTDQWFFNSGATLTLNNSSQFTITPTTNLGYSLNTMFQTNSNWNMNNSTVVFDMGALAYAGSVWSAYTSAGTCTVNFTDAVWTVNGTGASQAPVCHTYWSAASSINGWTINGTRADKLMLEMGKTAQKFTGCTWSSYMAGDVGNSTATVLFDTFQYTGSLTNLDASLGRQVKWIFVDSSRSDGAVLRWSTGTGNAGYYGVHYLRPTITPDKAGYAPLMRITPSALSSRYPSKTIQTTALTTVPVSNFYKDASMESTDGALPFVDTLDSKATLTTIDWTMEFRQAGWVDQTSSFAASTAKKGNVSFTASGVSDSNYVNATTAAADAALITVNTTTKTIAPVTGSLAWSPQRMYNALKNWWATYASNTDFLSATGAGILDLGDYNTDANISFIAGGSTDALTNVRTTGLINAASNGIPVIDSRGQATIWIFEEIEVGTSLAIYDNAGTTKYFQAQVTSAGTYSYYIAGGATGTYNVAVEKYPFKRETATFAANTGGILYFTPSYAEDVGITETTQSTVEAYTSLENPSKIYDRTAVFRLTEQGIKIGQIFTRSGTALEVQSGFSHVINKDAATVYGITGGVITTKSTSYAGDTKYTTEILVPPATLTANTTEVITIPFEDANGNSQLTINGGDGTFELWKVTTATATNDYATGTLLDTVGNVTYRFIGVTGFDIVGVDINSNIRRRTSMAKGIYTQAFYVGDQIQLAQAPQVIENGVKLDILQQDIDDIKGAGFTTAKQSLVSLRKHVTAQNQA